MRRGRAEARHGGRALGGGRTGACVCCLWAWLCLWAELFAGLEIGVEIEPNEQLAS